MRVAKPEQQPRPRTPVQKTRTASKPVVQTADHAFDYEAFADDVMRKYPKIMARLGE